jgi:RNA polymerase sigma factor (sigma-70 family)
MAHSSTLEREAKSPEKRARGVLDRFSAAVSARSPGSREAAPDQLATALMDLYRRTGSGEVFEALVELTSGQLLRRVRSRVRYVGDRLDPHELLQDALINIYRYPDRFDCNRPMAFRAWASTIVDNTVRRHLRRSRTGFELSLRPVEVLSQEADAHAAEPARQAAESEACAAMARTYHVFLALYLAAYHRLTDRERFVLQMVEVRALRYSAVGALLGIRPEAVKMVVFRARKRIFERMADQLGRGCAPATSAA